jgi:hypothetical protein
VGYNKRYTNTKLDRNTIMTNTIPKQEDAVKCDKEAQANEAPKQESQSVTVMVTGFSLFATTLK